MPFELTDNVHVDRNEGGKVEHLEHLQQPFTGIQSEALAVEAFPGSVASLSPNTPQALAEAYLRQVAPIYGFEEMVSTPSTADALTDESTAASTVENKLKLTEEKQVMGTTTVSYQQTHNGLPVWEAGVSVTIQPTPLRVTASQSSVHSDISIPSEVALDNSNFQPDAIDPATLKAPLGLKSKQKPTINGTRQLIYRYEPNQRIDPEAHTTSRTALEEGPPTLPLPPVPDSIIPGQHYVVTEVLFTLPVEGYGPVNWRAFIESNSGAVLYLRAFIASATSMIFRTDPLTATGTMVAPTAGAMALNPFRSAAPIEGLANGNPQALSGNFVQVVDIAAPIAVAPTQPNPPANFFYDAPTREFSAVNAYHHCDWLFRYMEGMGFNIASYFDGTTFPVPVDASAFDDAINARAPGNITGTGSDGFQFGLAGAPFPAVGIAADVRVVLHEFGHTLLWDSVHSPNFGFAHSAGDSLAAILMDPESALRTDPVRRFETFPWILPNRNHGRDVAAGWGWGGVNDVGGYNSEQILSTTLFRLYRSVGGDSADVQRRKLAARQVVYLIFRAIGSLASNPVIPTPRADVFATALMNADIGTANFEGYLGGAYHKVIRWSFERQGLYQPTGAPRPVTRAGAPPAVDVYINDGRNGEYPYQPVHWECRDIWNRLAPGTGGGSHETPVVGQTNYAYVRVGNRGTQPATNVVVRGYSANPGAGLSWPGDWTPMDTAQINVPGSIPPGGSVEVGPFEWTPRFVGHECMFMEVSADGDLSNIDARTFFPCANGPTAEWQLVPFDNNIAQRNVAPVPGGGGIQGLLAGFEDRRFTVQNPFDTQMRMEVRAEMPRFLTERRWRIHLDNREERVVFGLAPGASREVKLSLRPGEEFSREQVMQADGGVAIRVFVYANDMVIGGMTYQVDPSMDSMPGENEEARAASLSNTAMAKVVAEAQADDVSTVGNRLLLQLGVPQDALGRVQRVTLRKIVVEIEVGDAS